jgi:hypothetical protein
MSKDNESGNGVTHNERRETTKSKQFDRREYLKLAGATATGAAGFSASSGLASAGTSRYGISFDRVLHAVNDLGMDPNGNDPINSQLDFTDGTLIEFPPGEYLMQGKVYENGVNRWGIRGTGSDRGDVRFVPPDGNTQTMFQISGYDFRDDCTDILVENVTFDQSATKPTAASNQFYVKDGLEIHDVETYGYNPNRDEANQPNGEEINGLYLMIYDSNGTGVVENYNYVGETTVVDYPENASGIGAYRDHAGILYIRDCNIENRGEHAIYASRCKGDVRVEGGTFKNCANTNMRICGSGSYLKNATVGIDRDRSYFVEADTGEEKAGRGMRWESGDYGMTGGYMENCDFILDTDLNTPGLIRVVDSAGAVDIRDCRIQNNSSQSTNTVFIEAVNSASTPHDVEITNCSFTGSSPSPAVESNRSATVSVSDSCEDMPNGGGFVGDLSTSNISHSGCPVPGSGGGSDSTLNALTIEDDNTGESTHYKFTVSGDLEATDNISSKYDDISGSTADGAIGSGGRDTYKCSGDITDLTLDYSDGSGSSNGVTITVDEANNHIVVDGTSDGVTHDYRIAVSGDMRKGDNANSAETIHIDPNGDSATGAVAGGKDDFYYTGEIDEIEIDGSTRLTLTRKYKIAIEDYQDGTTANYTFSVSGSLEKGSKANSNDSVSGSTADGQVNGGTDTYIFTGRITDWNHSGAVHTYIDGKEVITPSLGNNTVTIEGSGTSTGYTFKVIGGLGKSAAGDSTINSGDTISGRTADGAVSSGDDSYDYRNGVRVANSNWNGLSHYFWTNS